MITRSNAFGSRNSNRLSNKSRGSQSRGSKSRGSKNRGSKSRDSKSRDSKSRGSQLSRSRSQTLKLRPKISSNEILRKAQSLRSVMTLNSQAEEIRNLRKVGFKKIEVFFKYLNFIGIIAIK